MSVLSALAAIGKIDSVQQALGAKDITSNTMKEAIKRWLELYFDAKPTREEDSCQRLPVVVVNKLVKTMFSEYTAKTVKGQPEIDTLLQDVGKVKIRAMQYAFVGGECLVKPVPIAGKGVTLVPIRRDCYIPLARLADGTIVDIAMTEQTVQGGKYYTLLERRTLQPDSSLVIRNRLYRSDDVTTLGIMVPLQALPQYDMLVPEMALTGINSIGMVQVKCPVLNTVDGSEDGAAIYASAEGLIRNINRNEQQLNREFELGRSRIVAPADMLASVGLDGKRKALTDDVFVGLEDFKEDTGLTIFSPALREQSYLARKQEYLRNIETLIGLKRGILSEVEAAERTATEITSSAGDYNLSIIDLQRVWEGAVRELVGLCVKLGKLYKLYGKTNIDPATDIIVEFGNGILYDEDKEGERRLAQVQAGLLAPELYLAWYYNLPCTTAEEREQIKRDYMPEMESLLGGE